MNGHLTDSFQLFRGTIVASVQLSSHYIEPLAQAGKMKSLEELLLQILNILYNWIFCG